MNFEADFNQDMKKFIQLLKKILKNYSVQDKKQDNKSPKEDSSSDLNLNVFIFPLISMSPDEMEELEEIYENFAFEDEKNSEELSSDLTDVDREFLRKHGIRF